MTPRDTVLWSSLPLTRGSLARGRFAAKARAALSIDFGLECREPNRTKKTLARGAYDRRSLAQADKAEGRVSAAVASSDGGANSMAKSIRGGPLMRYVRVPRPDAVRLGQADQHGRGASPLGAGKHAGGPLLPSRH